MNTKTISIIALALLPAALFTLTSCSSTSKPPPPPVGSSNLTYTKGVPGGVILQTFKTTATVTAIDQATREATLMGHDGKKFVVKAGPQVINFDQVRVGDQVTATVTQRVVASIGKEDAASGNGTAGVVVQAQQGDQPGGVMTGTTQVTGKIVAIDSDKRTATLRFKDGNTETLPIRKDVELSRLKVGEQVVFRVTDMVAIWVEKP